MDVGLLVLAGVGGAVVAVACAAARPDLVLCLAILTIPLQASFLSAGSSGDGGYAGSGFGLTPPELLFLLAGYGWALRRLLQRRLPYTSHPLSAPLLLLTLAILPGLLLARDPFAVVKTLVNWTAFFFIFQMLAADADERLLRRILGCMAVAGAVAGLMAVLGTNVAGQAYDAGTNTSSDRARGPFAHPAQLGLFLVLVVPAAIGLAVARAGRWRPLCLGAAALAMVGIALSLSRGALLALGGGLAVLLLWGPFRRIALAAVVVLFALSFAGVNPLGGLVNSDVLAQRLTSTREAVHGTDPRINVFRQTPRMVEDHPVFGVGADNFYVNAPDYDMLDPAVQSAPGHAHNIALNVAAELGLLGLAALAWFAVALTRTLLSLSRRAEGTLRIYAVAAGSALFALTLYGLTDYPLIVNVLAAMVWVWAGCVPALDRLTRASARAPAAVPRPAVRIPRPLQPAG